MIERKKYYAKEEITQLLFEQIESYINGTMNKNELTKFEKQLQNNSKLQNELRLQQRLQMAIEIEALSEKNSTLKTTKNNKIISLKTIISVAATVAILIIPAYYFFAPKHPDLFKTYYKPDAGLPTVMGTVNNYTFQDAMVDYKMEKYQQAKNKWQKMAVNIKQNDTLNYYIAMADLNLKKYDDANVMMSKVPKNSVFYSKVLWYQALIAIQQKNYSEAKIKLKELNTEQAQEVLNKIPNE